MPQASFAAAMALGDFEAAISIKISSNRFSPTSMLRIVRLDFGQPTAEQLAQ